MLNDIIITPEKIYISELYREEFAEGMIIDALDDYYDPAELRETGEKYLLKYLGTTSHPVEEKQTEDGPGVHEWAHKVVRVRALHEGYEW